MVIGKADNGNLKADIGGQKSEGGGRKCSYRPLTLFSFRLSGALCAIAFAFFEPGATRLGIMFFAGVRAAVFFEFAGMIQG